MRRPHFLFLARCRNADWLFGFRIFRGRLRHQRFHFRMAAIKQASVILYPAAAEVTTERMSNLSDGRVGLFEAKRVQTTSYLVDKSALQCATTVKRILYRV